MDREYGIFTETVARNRKASKKEIVATQAAVLWADNAMPLLADEVGTFDDAMNALRGAISWVGEGQPVGKATGSFVVTQYIHWRRNPHAEGETYA